MTLINDLIDKNYLRTPRIIEAFRRIRRADFIPDKLESLSEADIPLPIGYRQTISQPLTVAFMMELLDPKEGNKILDIGFGSGWTTALLAEITGEKGNVTAVEIISELCAYGANNIDKYKFIKNKRVEILCQDGSSGYAFKAPYGRILVSASAKEISNELKKQLKINGKLVIPVSTSIWMIERISKKEYGEKEYPGFVFVPLINQKSRFKNQN